MDYNRAIQVLENELECVNRDECDRECCARCDLAMDKADVLEALDLAVACISTFNSQDLIKANHAHWVHPFHGNVGSYCSYCKRATERLESGVYFEPDYCPHCGARMDGEA